jgi:LmbE family N-acetylglucosaminyl deacetylase
MKKALGFCLFFYSMVSFAQQKVQSSSEIYQGLLKLNTVGSAMYVAAHPDDENTLLITWLSKYQKVETAYIAMTRGDGGQNLLGTEQGAAAGVLRTQELLKARSVDGGKQFFTRAVDFGYTKTTDEALQTWGEEKVLYDLVYRIRKFQPDVMITRFPPDERAGHGHHSASAVLAAEAFDFAADATKFPDQLKDVTVWQPKRLVWNHYARGFRNQSPEEGSYIEVSLGDYNEVLGESYPEIAAEARSMHKSQGFGSAKVRNQRTDYLLHVKGEPAKSSVFDGVDTSWNRMKGGKEIGKKIEIVISNFDFKNPTKSVTLLLEIHKLISLLPESHYKSLKLNEVKSLILSTSGLWMEAVAANQYVSQGDSLQVFFQANNRSKQTIKLESITYNETKNNINKTLSNNNLEEFTKKVYFTADYEISQPYWLLEEQDKGFYNVSDKSLVGLPFQPPSLIATYNFTIEGTPISFETPLIYKYVEPSFGEIYQPLAVRPEVMVNFQQDVFTFTDNQSKSVSLTIKSSKDNVAGDIELSLPLDWKSTPASQSFAIEEKGNETIVKFELFPSSNASKTEIKAMVTVDGKIYNRGYQTIGYQHIPFTTLFPKATAEAIRVDLRTAPKRIGYIMGAGDEVPAALQNMGYAVKQLNEQNLLTELPALDVVIIGVRAYNTENWLPLFQTQLFRFVNDGGTLITQYQTSSFYRSNKDLEIGPYPLRIGRDRVTDENSKIEFVNASDSLLNFPNKITQNDFDGWIQERGLYFADSWSDKYETVFKMKDAGETELEGSLLHAKYGKGNYIFTGLSFFRQLPVGVPGAYRLLANLIAVE